MYHKEGGLYSSNNNFRMACKCRSNRTLRYLKIQEKNWKGSIICLKYQGIIFNCGKMHIVKQPNWYVRRIFLIRTKWTCCRKSLFKDFDAF